MLGSFDVPCLWPSSAADGDQRFKQFSDEKNLLRYIDEALQVSGMDPTLLQIEITESMVMLNAKRQFRCWMQYRAGACVLPSTISEPAIRRCPSRKRFTTDTIKIDRSFVRDLPQKSEDIPIARAIIEMGRALGLTVIAEGVEPTSLRCCISPSLWATELNVARVHLICADFTRPLRFERSVSLRLASLA